MGNGEGSGTGIGSQKDGPRRAGGPLIPSDPVTHLTCDAAVGGGAEARTPLTGALRESKYLGRASDRGCYFGVGNTKKFLSNRVHR